LAVAAPLFARHDPFGVDLINSLQAPNPAHWFGTDIQGRDVWARLVYGARVSLSVGIVSQGIALTLGVVLGLLAGYYGRWIDEFVMRLADVTLAFPTLLLLIALVAALQPSLTVVFLTIGAAWLVSHRNRGDEHKGLPYESGIDTYGDTHGRFGLSFYIYALLFVAFDIEVIFLYLWAMVFKTPALMGPAFVSMLVFVGILLLGLAYAWRKGALSWR
jgi:NADH:ubiquinone oxidoreductase subunit 3 (subunit A)